MKVKELVCLCVLAHPLSSYLLIQSHSSCSIHGSDFLTTSSTWTYFENKFQLGSLAYHIPWLIVKYQLAIGNSSVQRCQTQTVKKIWNLNRNRYKKSKLLKPRFCRSNLVFKLGQNSILNHILILKIFKFSNFKDFS